MNLLKYIQNFLTNFESHLTEYGVLSGICEQEGILSISLNEEKIISTDVLNNKTLQKKYDLNVLCDALNETDRTYTYDTLQKLSDWIEEQNSLNNYPILAENYHILGMSSTSPKLIKRLENSLAYYQIELTITYIKGDII